jgi:P27 family predicted phage terminase small subunit
MRFSAHTGGRPLRGKGQHCWWTAAGSTTWPATNDILRGPDMRGRRPKPSRVKVLTGNPGKRPLNAKEPMPEAKVPDCPAELGPVARREWDRLASERGKLRILTALDRSILAAYCNAYGLWAEATEAIQKFGTMVKSPSGFPIQSPYVAIANRQAEIMMRIASEFGFTPASRSRISTPAKREPNLLDLMDVKQ